MESLLGISMDAIALGSLAASALVLGSLLLAVLRQPLLLRLALCGPPRRPLQTGLVLIGLALSTIVIGTALNTGDTISHTIRTLVASSVGRADEVVLALPRDQRRSPSEYVTALLNGTLLTGFGTYFPEEQAARLAGAISRDDRLAGMTPAIGEQATAVNRAQEALAAQIRLLALPVDFPPVFGSLVSPTGEPLALTDLRPSELLANTDAAALLRADPGDLLEVRTRDGTFAFTLRAIAETGSLSGAQPTLYVPLPHYQTLAHRQGWINQILVANRGEAATSVRLSA